MLLIRISSSCISEADMPVSWLGVLLQEIHLQLFQSGLIEKKNTFPEIEKM